MQIAFQSAEIETKTVEIPVENPQIRGKCVRNVKVHVGDVMAGQGDVG